MIGSRVDALVRAKLANLEEFRYLSEDKVRPWLTKLGLGEEAMLQCGSKRGSKTVLVLPSDFDALNSVT